MVGGSKELALIQSWEASEEKLSSVLVSSLRVTRDWLWILESCGENMLASSLFPAGAY